MAQVWPNPRHAGQQRRGAVRKAGGMRLNLFLPRMPHWYWDCRQVGQPSQWCLPALACPEFHPSLQSVRRSRLTARLRAFALCGNHRRNKRAQLLNSTHPCPALPGVAVYSLKYIWRRHYQHSRRHQKQHAPRVRHQHKKRLPARH